jgi:hypothetical protein
MSHVQPFMMGVHRCSHVCISTFASTFCPSVAFAVILLLQTLPSVKLLYVTPEQLVKSE